ncbi:hypothetical protein [Iodidimonas sp. SYSU 1G8]|uniref:beta strand repeat-containing protein n=1 Tax=Iodidimonas sp. SYSU 1G8 TaxID=3133967 RepID=UPI0031FE9025
MRKSQVLATVSVIALASAGITSAAFAVDQFNATVNWVTEVPTVVAGSSSVDINNNQNNTNTDPTANITNVIMGVPAVLGTQDYNGLDSVIVEENIVSAIAVLNTSVDYDNVSPTYVDPLQLDPIAWNSIDLWTATGSGASAAATLVSLQSSDGGSILTASVSNVDVQADSSDLFAGSSQLVNDNTVRAQAMGNETINTISGDINPLLSSTEIGHAGISGGPNLAGNAGTGSGLGASATVLVASAQENDNLGASSATVDNTRIGSLAVELDTTTTIEGIPLEVTGNDIGAVFIGNSATNQVNLDDDLDLANTSAVTLDGTAGVANAQRNTTVGMTFLAQVTESQIEAGESGAVATPISNLTGSSIDFSANTITAQGTGNGADNLVRLGDGISQSGNFPGGGIINPLASTALVNGGGPDGNANAVGDLFIANHQFGEVAISALVGGATAADDGDMNVLVESVLDSSVDAVGNLIGASALGNDVGNAIVVEGAATFDSLVSIASAQILNNGSSSTATTNGDITVSVATLGTVNGDIATSSVTVDRNSLSSQASGNVGSNTIDIEGTNINGVGVDPDANFALSSHTNIAPRVAADFGIVSGQFTREAEYTATTTGSVLVDAADVSGAVGSSILDSDISASTNNVSALAVANRITENSFIVGDEGPTASFTGTVGVINAQLAQGSGNTATDHLSMSATVAPSNDGGAPAIINVDATALATDQSDISADSNSISARIFGNLVDANTNSIDISAVTVGDGVVAGVQASNPTAVVYRSVADASIGNGTPDGLPDTVVQGGFVLINDQSVEDISANALGDVPWVANVTGNFVDVQVGSTNAAATITATDVSTSLNAVTGSITGNQGSNALSIDAVTLDGTSTLVNTQTFANETTGFTSFSGSMDVNVAGDILNTVSAGATTISDVNVEANSNTVMGSARVNNASNTVSVAAQTQVVTDIVTGNDVNSVEMSYGTAGTHTVSNVLLRSETGLLNSQEFGSLRPSGLDVLLSDTDVLVTVNTADGALADSVVAADLNSFTAQSLGNDAGNLLTLEVGTFDLTDAGSATATNGPLGIIANQQRGSDADNTGSVSSLTGGVNVTVDVSGIDTSITGTDVTADGNSIRSLSRINNAVNVLDASGTTYENAVTAASSVEILDVAEIVSTSAASVEMTVEDLAFGIASFQVNAIDVNSTVTGGGILVNADNVDAISDSSLSVSGNLQVAEARGSDVTSVATLDFGTNHVSGFVANLQQTDAGGATLTSNATGNVVVLEADTATQTLTDSSFAADSNAIAAITSANRATNSASALGTNLYSGTGQTTPSGVINPAVTSDITVSADLSVVNVQGAEAVVSTQDDILTANTAGNTVVAVLDDLDSGSVSVDNNLVLSQGTIHSATNAGRLDAAANVGTTGDTVSAIVLSQQIVTSGSSVTTTTAGNAVLGLVDDMSDAGSASLSVSGNDILSQAAGGTASNRLDVLADAAIVGGAPAATPSFVSAILTVNADFSVLNAQFGETDISATTTGTGIAGDVGTVDTTPLNNDAVDVNANLVSASSTGFSAANILVLDAGSSSDATGQVGNRQSIVTGSTLSSTTTGTGVGADIAGGALNSSIEVSGNEVSAVTTGSTALNALQTSADSTLQESSGAGGAIDPATGITVSGADYAVLNWQSAAGSSFGSTVAGTSIGVDDLAGGQGVDNSSVEVNGNAVIASTVANNSVNSLVLNTGTFQHPSASVSNLQTTSDSTVSASVSGTSVGIGLGGGLINNASSNSSFTVRGNSVGSSAIGNGAISSISGN